MEMENFDCSSLFQVMSANDAMAEVDGSSEPRKLFGEYWYDGEVCCLFADSNVGKSILAVQIGEEIAKSGDTVLYYDFELSKRQFELRYSNHENGTRHEFPKSFNRVELKTDGLPEEVLKHLDTFIIKGIEKNIVDYGCHYIIVDNISWLSNMKTSAFSAGKLMMELINLKKKYELSILVLSHTIKRDPTKPINQNHLNGSKRFCNFFDSMFAIGQCLQAPKMRYLKQIKVRNGEFTHDASNVELFKIEKDNELLKIKTCGTTTEKEAIKGTSDKKTKQKVSRRAVARMGAHNIEKLAESSFLEFFKR